MITVTTIWANIPAVFAEVEPIDLVNAVELCVIVARTEDASVAAKTI